MDPLGFLILLSMFEKRGGKKDEGHGGGDWPQPPEHHEPPPKKGGKKPPADKPPGPLPPHPDGKAPALKLQPLPAGYAYYSPPSQPVVAMANNMLRDSSFLPGQVRAGIPDPTVGAPNLVAFRKEPTKDKAGAIKMGVTAWKHALQVPPPAITPVPPAGG